MLLLNAREVERLADMPRLVAAVEAGVREQAAGQVVLPPRLNLPNGRGFFRIMPTVMNGSGIMGFKAFHGSVQDGVRYFIAIYEQASGVLLAMMDAHYLTAARTGATTGVATRFMAGRSARRVAVIGSGLEARTNLLGVCAVRDVERVTVFSPNRERRVAFAERMSQELKIEVRACDTPESCVEGADIVVVATNTTGKGDGIAFRGAWARAGMHINAIGSTMPKLREIDRGEFCPRRTNSNRLPDKTNRRRIGRRHRRARPRHVRPRQSYRTAGSRRRARIWPQGGRPDHAVQVRRHGGSGRSLRVRRLSGGAPSRRRFRSP